MLKEFNVEIPDLPQLIQIETTLFVQLVEKRPEGGVFASLAQPALLAASL